MSLHNEIQDACEGFVSRWVVVAEVIEASDERELHVLSGSGLGNGGPPPWDVIGMLEAAKNMATDRDED